VLCKDGDDKHVRLKGYFVVRYFDFNFDYLFATNPIFARLVGWLIKLNFMFIVIRWINLSGICL
jgi:hypothetical protein